MSGTPIGPAGMGRAALALALGAALAAGSAAAQEIGAARRERVSDPAAQALNHLLTAAQAEIAAKDYAAAQKSLTDYLQARPEDAQANFMLGYVYTALGNAAGARTQFQKAATLDPTMSDAFLDLGLTYLQEDPAAAIAPLRKAAELKPDDPHVKRLLATALARSGKPDEALAEYLEVEKADANDPDVHLGLANTYLDLNRTADAEREYRSAISLDSANPAGHAGLGECLEAEKKYEDAAGELAAYLKTRPNDEKARAARVTALIELSKYDDALAELDRGSPAAQASLDWLKLRYEALAGGKHYDEAAAALAKAEVLAPQDAEIHQKFGATELERKNYVHSAQEFLAAEKIAPQDNTSLSGLMTATYLAQDYTDSLTALDQLEQREPLAPASLFIRADCYDKLGKRPEALEAYEKFLAANHDLQSDMYFAAAARQRELQKELGKKPR